MTADNVHRLDKAEPYRRCQDCHYAKPDDSFWFVAPWVSRWRFGRCQHADAVDHEPVDPTSSARLVTKQYYCRTMRKVEGCCGAEARWFKPREPERIRRDRIGQVLVNLEFALFVAIMLSSLGMMIRGFAALAGHG